jgi:FdrA protein
MKLVHADPLETPIVAINVGLGMFAESLRAQGVQVVQVDWVPPAGGDQQLADLLDELL